MKVRIGALLTVLLLVNLAVMAVDSMLLPEQGSVQVAPVNPAPRVVQPRPTVRPPNELQLFLRGLGIRPIGTEQRSQPDLRPAPADPRTRFPERPQQPPSLRPFSLHQSGASGMAVHLVALLSLASIAVVLTYFLPDRLRVMRGVLGGPWTHQIRTLIIGALGYLAALLLAALLAALVSGLIFSLLGIAILTALTAVGVTSVALALGKWLTVRIGASAGPMAQLAAGLLVVFPLTILPYYFGWAAAGIIASFGMGAILLTRLGGGRPWTLEALE